MSELKRCKRCGVPLNCGKAHSWNPDGTITERSDPDHRMVIFESDGIGILFSNIEELLGTSIEKIIIESKARATKSYISHLIKGPKGTLARLVGLERIIGRVIDQGRALGYGDIKLVDYDWNRFELTCDVKNPYSLALFCGDFRGSAEALRKMPGTVTYKRIGDNHFVVEGRKAKPEEGLKERLIPKPPPRKPGNIEYEKCPVCKTPKEISSYVWDLEKGTIFDPKTSLRLAVFGPEGLDVIFEELENELGETIPEAIIEAQRRRAETILSQCKEEMGREAIQRILGLHGLGNLLSLESEGSSTKARIANPALPLILVGWAQALYEKASGERPSTEFGVEPTGDLVIQLSA